MMNKSIEIIIFPSLLTAVLVVLLKEFSVEIWESAWISAQNNQNIYDTTVTSDSLTDSNAYWWSPFVLILTYGLSGLFNPIVWLASSVFIFLSSIMVHVVKLEPLKKAKIMVTVSASIWWGLQYGWTPAGLITGGIVLWAAYSIRYEPKVTGILTALCFKPHIALAILVGAMVKRLTRIAVLWGLIISSITFVGAIVYFNVGLDGFAVFGEALGEEVGWNFPLGMIALGLLFIFDKSNATHLILLAVGVAMLATDSGVGDWVWVLGVPVALGKYEIQYTIASSVILLGMGEVYRFSELADYPVNQSIASLFLVGLAWMTWQSDQVENKFEIKERFGEAQRWVK